MEIKKCPHCGREIKIQAIKCKHCNEFLKDNIGFNSVNNQKLLAIPPSWYYLKKIEIIYTILGAILLGIVRSSSFREQMNDDLLANENPTYYIDIIFDIISLVFEIVTIFYIHLLIRYLDNYIEKSRILKILFIFSFINISAHMFLSAGVLGIIVVPDDTADYFAWIYIIIIPTILFLKYKIGKLLFTNRKDKIGSMKTIGKYFFFFAILDIIWIILVFSITQEDLMLADLNNGTHWSGINFVIITKAIFAIIYCYLTIQQVSKALKKAVEHNEQILLK